MGCFWWLNAGDGVVTEDEFTTWAKEQAVRVQVWERRLEDVMSQWDVRLEDVMSELSEQVERTVDHDVLSQRWVIFVVPSVVCARV